MLDGMHHDVANPQHTGQLDGLVNPAQDICPVALHPLLHIHLEGRVGLVDGDAHILSMATQLLAKFHGISLQKAAVLALVHTQHAHVHAVKASLRHHIDGLVVAKLLYQVLVFSRDLHACHPF